MYDDSVYVMREDRNARRAWSRSLLITLVAILAAVGGLIYAGILIAQTITEITG